MLLNLEACPRTKYYSTFFHLSKNSYPKICLIHSNLKSIRLLCKCILVCMMSTLDFSFAHEKKLWMLMLKNHCSKFFPIENLCKVCFALRKNCFWGKNGRLFFFYSSHFPYSASFLAKILQIFVLVCGTQWTICHL